jgi:hypothetical protein
MLLVSTAVADESQCVVFVTQVFLSPTSRSLGMVGDRLAGGNACADIPKPHRDNFRHICH